MSAALAQRACLRFCVLTRPAPRRRPLRSPWNYYRSSGDIRASYDAVVGNLQTTIQWAKAGLSYPGCWAYPDMLEVRYC